MIVTIFWAASELFIFSCLVDMAHDCSKVSHTPCSPLGTMKGPKNHKTILNQKNSQNRSKKTLSESSQVGPDFK